MKTAFLVFNLLFSFLVLGLPYQKNCSEKENTKKILFSQQETKAGRCHVCSLQDDNYATLKEIDLEVQRNTNSIPKECFLAMAVRGNQIFEIPQYNYCDKEKQLKPNEGQKFCMNEDYITAIHQAFERISFCFGFDKKRKEDVFYLINHESAGILNVRSERGARCLGQITEGYVKDINRIIDTQNPIYADIWTSALKKCSDLDSFLIDMKYITCQSTQNPYTCLLYTFFGLEKSHKNLKERLNSNPDYMGNKKAFKTADEMFPEQKGEPPHAKSRYEKFLAKRPIKRNEMLTVKATHKEGGDIDWVIWDDSEIHGLYNRIDWTKEVNIQKEPLFNKEKDIETMFTYWSHNGGHSLSRGRFSRRVEKLKQSIAESCSDTDKSLRRCRMREQIKSGQGVSSSLALEFFYNDILHNYSSKNLARREEVANYVSNVVGSHDIIFPDEDDNKQRNTLLGYHEKNGIDIHGTTEAQDFQNEVSEICPEKINFK